MLLVLFIAAPLTTIHAQAPAICEECNDDQSLANAGFCFNGNPYCPPSGNTYSFYDPASEACLISKGCIPINQNYWILIAAAAGIVALNGLLNKKNKLKRRLRLQISKITNTFCTNILKRKIINI